MKLDKFFKDMNFFRRGMLSVLESDGFFVHDGEIYFIEVRSLKRSETFADISPDQGPETEINQDNPAFADNLRYLADHATHVSMSGKTQIMRNYKVRCAERVPLPVGFDSFQVYIADSPHTHVYWDHNHNTRQYHVDLRIETLDALLMHRAELDTANLSAMDATAVHGLAKILSELRKHLTYNIKHNQKTPAGILQLEPPSVEQSPKRCATQHEEAIESCLNRGAVAMNAAYEASEERRIEAAAHEGNPFSLWRYQRTSHLHHRGEREEAVPLNDASAITSSSP